MGPRFSHPSEDKEVINSLAKWDQAFRIYASIYSESNPTRASEIWQYIESIHDAAKTFPWENVANYDYMFRRLMDEFPERSWAKQYIQMWNRTMCEGLYRGSNNNQRSVQNSSGKKEIVCWKFNKGKCSYGTACKFEHKCAYCQSYNHGSKNCSKKASDRRGSSEGHVSQQTSGGTSESRGKQKSNQVSESNIAR